MSVEDSLHPQTWLRRTHEQLILRAIGVRGPISRAELARDTNLSAQAVGSIVGVLLDDGLVWESAMLHEKRPGAPAVALELRSNGAFAFGVGLERDYLTVVLLDLAGDVQWQTGEPIGPDADSAATIEMVQKTVERLLCSPQWSGARTRVRGLGIAAPGPVDLRKGLVVGPPNFPGWETVHVVEALADRLGMPILVENAANAAALAVGWKSPQEHKDFLYCYWGVGIGGGLVRGFDVYEGATGNSIEIGHVVADVFGRVCACGGRGCLETVASLSSLMERAQQWGRFETLEQLVAAASSDERVLALLQDVAEHLAAALVSVVNVVDVEEVVLGGAHFLTVRDIFLPIIAARLDERPFRHSIAPVQVSVAELGEVAAAIGAALLVVKEMLPARRTSGRRRARPATSRARSRQVTINEIVP